MSTIKNADDQPDDQFGYSCYALVIPAPDDIVEKCSLIEQASGMTRAKIPAHITVKGTFCRIDSLGRVKEIIGSITSNTPSFEISLANAEANWGKGSGGLSVPITANMQGLHDALVAEIAPITVSAYVDDPYRAHMTFVQEASQEGIQRAKELASQMSFGDGFNVSAIDMMGRVGKAYGGAWKLVQRFPLDGQN